MECTTGHAWEATLARDGIPIRTMTEAFIWHARRGTPPLTAKIPGHGEVPLRYSKWPDYGFDEAFQLIAMYPWLAPKGTLTFIPSDARSLLLPADIEYAMWTNPRSEGCISRALQSVARKCSAITRSPPS
ncbi:MAG: hypothetical protein EOP09_00290 [Proteobacteria bacterium]|nr:MAG: hypothetical protein EOP09_00290 [Pseudomonadota bacterium]